MKKRGLIDSQFCMSEESSGNLQSWQRVMVKQTSYHTKPGDGELKGKCYIFNSYFKLLRVMASSFIHVPAKNMISFFFMAAQYSMVYVYHIFFIQSIIDGHFVWFHDYAIVNSAAINIHVYVSIQQNDLCFSGYTPSNGIAGSNYISASRSLRNVHTVFHSGRTNLHFHHISPQPHQDLLFLDFLISAIVTGMRWDLIVVWICISLIFSDVQHIFKCLLAV